MLEELLECLPVWGYGEKGTTRTEIAEEAGLIVKRQQGICQEGVDSAKGCGVLLLGVE